jgi:tetratricopeptide (TPR) repeat protein
MDDMFRLALALAFVVLSGGSALADSTSTASVASSAADASKATIQKLISQLGDEQFAVRRHAEEDLVRLGPEAFDQLKAAEDAADLEVAERARYIIQRMRVDWVRAEDSPEIRRTLARYGDLSQPEREKRIAKLNELKDGEGLPALCRIARLEPAPTVARRAALTVLGRQSSAEAKVPTAACLEELSSSQRAPVVWIKLWLRELTDRKGTIEDWSKAVEAEIALLKEESPETTGEITYELLKRRLETCNELHLVDETSAALLQIVDLFSDKIVHGGYVDLRWALRWIIDHKRWDVLTKVQEQRRDEIESSPGNLYHVAAAEIRAGRDAEGQKLAKTALEMKSTEMDRLRSAHELADLGFVDWCEREYRRVIADAPVVSRESLAAREGLAVWLHDREDFKGAADLLTEFFDGMKDDPAAKQRLSQTLNGRQDFSYYAAKREFFMACSYEKQGQYDKQREALSKSVRLFEDDPDVLIAMYRSKGADAAFHEQALKRIHDMSDRVKQVSDQDPDTPTWHNEWAWLIADTEGDYGEAVKHSLRSLELSPDEPSYLDTLGRCYYAAGDLQKAVESQRKAVELAPQYQVMRRQLAQFERELAAKTGSPKKE